MNFFEKLGAVMRRRSHESDIEESLRRYTRFSGQKPGVKQAFSDSGTFRSQVDRLFAIGNASETGPLKQIAETVVSSTLTNRYYRASDYLSDVVDDLERLTFLTGEVHGEPGLSEELEPHVRELKLKAVSEAWLVPLKVASIEASVGTYSTVIGRALPYTSLRDFERAVARIFAATEESERTLIEGRVRKLVSAWHENEVLRARFDAPSKALLEAMSHFRGEIVPAGIEGLRTRRADQPMRLSTVVPEDRQHYLRASLAVWETEP